MNLDNIPWKYKPIKLQLSELRTGQKIGTQTIMALCYKGLAYHPAFLVYHNKEEKPKGWCVTHIKSGIRFGGPNRLDPTQDFGTEDEAAEFLVKIANLCNWNDLNKVREDFPQVKIKVKELYKTITGKEAHA